MCVWRDPASSESKKQMPRNCVMQRKLQKITFSLFKSRLDLVGWLSVNMPKMA